MARATSVPSLETKQPASADRPSGERIVKGHLLAATWTCSLLWLSLALLANTGVWEWGVRVVVRRAALPALEVPTLAVCGPSMPCSRGSHHLPSHSMGGASHIACLGQPEDLCWGGHKSSQSRGQLMSSSHAAGYGYGPGWALDLGA